MRPDDWLNPDDAKMALEMEECVRSQWQAGPDATPFTPHDPAHFERVEHWIRRLIPRGKWSQLSSNERKILTWCSWTHDIGMLRSVHTPDSSDVEIRDQHVKTSANWVGDNYAQLRLTPLEAQVIAEINRYHSRKLNLKDCPELRQFHGEFVRSRLLAAYLRIADALEVDFDRVHNDQYHRFDLLIHQLAPDNDQTLFHWVKSFIVSGIHLEHDRQEIHVEFMRAKDIAQDKFEYVKRYVVNEIEDELASVERTLAKGGLSCFQQVISAEVELVDGSVKNQLDRSLQRVLSYVQMARSPNSTAVTKAALDALKALLDRTNQAKDNTEWSSFLSGLQLLGQSLADQLTTRQCHIELRQIYDYIKKTLDEHQLERKYDISVIESLLSYGSNFERLIGRDLAASSRSPSPASQVCALLGRLHLAVLPLRIVSTLRDFGCSSPKVLAEFFAVEIFECDQNSAEGLGHLRTCQC